MPPFAIPFLWSMKTCASSASRAFFQVFHLLDGDVRGHLIYEIDDGQWDIPELRTILETIAKDHATVEGYEVDRDFPRVGRRIMLLNARKVFYEAAPDMLSRVLWCGRFDQGLHAGMDIRSREA